MRRPRTRSPRCPLAAAAALLMLPAQAADYTWSAGNLSASGLPATLQAADLAQVNAGGLKYVDMPWQVQGRVNWADTLYFVNGNTVTVAAGGLWTALADVGLHDGGWNGHFVVDTGATFRKAAGAGDTTVAGVGFVGRGAIEVQTGRIVFASGNASFENGVQFLGAGQAVVTNNAAYGGAISASNLRWIGGTHTGNAAQFSGHLVWTIGTLAGSWTVAAGQVDLVGGNYKYLNGSLVNQATLDLQDRLYLQNGSGLGNQGLITLGDGAGFLDGGWGGTVNNTGTLRKQASAGAASIGSGVGVVNSGVIDVQGGSLAFASGNASFLAGTQFVGAGTAVLSSHASFSGRFDSANLLLQAGTFSGTAAELGGVVRWQTGTLAGGWTVAPGQQLRLESGNYKYLNGSLLNQGTLAFSDTLYLQNGHTLTNQALLDLQGDVGLGDGGWSGTLHNQGLLRKSAGGGAATLTGVAFVNQGSIEVQQGRVELAGGSVTMHAGSQFVGPGELRVSSGAVFNGAFQSQNLHLAAGVFNGNAAQIGGQVNWTTGTLAGTWSLPAAQTLSLLPGNYKYLNGSFSNQGRVQAMDSVYLQNGSVLSNGGLYELNGDVGVGDGGWGGSFVNTGRVVKTSGTGVSSLAAVGFSNAAGGVVEVRSGSVALPANFHNDGTLTGTGGFALAGTLVNQGVVAPGASPGTLTLAGSFAQAATGVLAIELQQPGATDMLQVLGTAALGGTLALSCFAACSFAVGDSIVVLQSTGSLSGSFAATTLSGFGTGAFQTVYDYAGQRVLLQVTEAVTAVPEPASTLLWLGGLATLLLRRRLSARGSTA